MASLRIMTLNLLVDRADPADLHRVLDDVDPDVLAVQELGPRAAGHIRRRFDHGHLDPQEDLFGLGLVARRPVGIAPLDLPGRAGWVATLEPSIWGFPKHVDVIGVHLLNPVDRPWRATRDLRRAQVAGVERRVAESRGATVVIGDMNSTRRWPEYRRLEAIGTDAARTTRSAAPTWSHFTRGPRWIRIDHAFVAGVVPLRTRTMRVRGTDHRALVVDVDVGDAVG
jgi:endonuclease/exonuclease/phosphatase (EEP) superfamily protein YafD